MRVSSAEERFQWAYDIVKMIMEYTPDFWQRGRGHARRHASSPRPGGRAAGGPAPVLGQPLGAPNGAGATLRSLTRTAVCDCDCGWVWACEREGLHVQFLYGGGGGG